jgi:hypothetical protein
MKTRIKAKMYRIVTIELRSLGQEKYRSKFTCRSVTSSPNSQVPPLERAAAVAASIDAIVCRVKLPATRPSPGTSLEVKIRSDVFN